ncbi:hypothetical protein ACROYT_G036039 [Oculina patagonica]
MPTMFRLPMQSSAEGLDACFLGIPLDGGSYAHRTGARMGPRQIRCESCLIRPHNTQTGAAPYESLMVADVGDVAINVFNLGANIGIIQQHVANIVKTGCKPLIMGGDHTITYPILRALKEKYGPVGLLQLDAHPDTSETTFGEKISNATPFRRAVEEGLLDCKRVVQIGLRGTGNSPIDYEFGRSHGFKIVPAKYCWYKSMEPLMGQVRELMGDAPVYITFDIDAVDPGYAPGTGTHEVGGLTVIQVLEIIRGCRGMNIIGGDLVEVSPWFDVHGGTSILAANLLYEMMCVLPGVIYKDAPTSDFQF